VRFLFLTQFKAKQQVYGAGFVTLLFHRHHYHGRFVFLICGINFDVAWSSRCPKVSILHVDMFSVTTHPSFAYGESEAIFFLFDFLFFNCCFFLSSFSSFFLYNEIWDGRLRKIRFRETNTDDPDTFSPFFCFCGFLSNIVFHMYWAIEIEWW